MEPNKPIHSDQFPYHTQNHWEDNAPIAQTQQFYGRYPFFFPPPFLPIVPFPPLFFRFPYRRRFFW